MKTLYLLLPLLLFSGTALARKPFEKRPQIDYYETVIFELPADTCEYVNNMSIPNGLVRGREEFTAKFYLVGPQGQHSNPFEMIIQGGAIARREARLRRRRGEPDDGLTVKLRRKERVCITFTAVDYLKQPWMDEVTEVKVEQTILHKGREYTLPTQTIRPTYREGYNSGHTQSNAETE